MFRIEFVKKIALVLDFKIFEFSIFSKTGHFVKKKKKTKILLHVSRLVLPAKEPPVNYSFLSRLKLAEVEYAR